ncbi:MAG TPA: methyltransferase domain-containing protein, partial [Dehalococcoidia bacterium]|nr:methyltransferase domain-containing protein [Dehalococcoidia bacterium]
ASLVTETSISPGDDLLDVGCGTGIVARTVRERAGPAAKIVGADLDPGVLDVARRVAPDLAWHVASADALPFADGSFQIVLCQMALQYFPDRPAALREMRRVLRSGGRVGVGVCGPIERAPGFLAVSRGIERLLGPEAAQLGPFALSDRETLGSLLRVAGFDRVEVRVARPTLRAQSPRAWVRILRDGAASIRKTLARLTEEELESLTREVEGELAPHVGDGGLAFPVDYHIGLGWR